VTRVKSKWRTTVEYREGTTGNFVRSEYCERQQREDV
jgi:hypothetical protein